EGRRAQMEAYLGSDEQLGRGGDPLAKYNVSVSYGGGHTGPRGYANRTGPAQIAEMKRLAAAGDFAGADALLATIQGNVQRTNAWLSAPGRNRKELMSLTGGGEPGAGLNMDGPMDLLMGNLLRDALDIQDPNSAQAKDLVDSMTRGPLAQVEAGRVSANRAIGSQERTSARQARDLGLARGSARGAGADQALATARNMHHAGQRAEVELKAGAARATIHGQAAQKYQEFKRAWGVNAVAAAQQYIDNKATVRDEYVNAILTTRLAAANLYGQQGGTESARSNALGAQATSLAQTDAQISAQDDGGGWGAIVGAVAGIALSFIPGVGPVVGAAIIGATTTAGNAVDN
ncbi:MAG: hypothetical protein ACPGWS_09265, partial [Solirubrobacterales bacterium]